jgi:hypothetical protein
MIAKITAMTTIEIKIFVLSDVGLAGGFADGGGGEGVGSIVGNGAGGVGMVVFVNSEVTEFKPH